ncbi:hypothetical protein AB4Z29_12320 [Paenibacillus sp. 2TAB23]
MTRVTSLSYVSQPAQPFTIGGAGFLFMKEWSTVLSQAGEK